MNKRKERTETPPSASDHGNEDLFDMTPLSEGLQKVESKWKETPDSSPSPGASDDDTPFRLDSSDEDEDEEKKQEEDDEALLLPVERTRGQRKKATAATSAAAGAASHDREVSKVATAAANRGEESDDSEEESDDSEEESDGYSEDESEEEPKKKRGGGTKKKKEAVGGTKKKRGKYNMTEEGTKKISEAARKQWENGTSNLRHASSQLVGTMHYRLVDVMGQARTNRTMSQKYHSGTEGKVANDELEEGIVVYGKKAMANLCDAIGLDGWKKYKDEDDDDKKGRYVRDKLCATVHTGMGFEEDNATRGDGINSKYWKKIDKNATFIFNRTDNEQTNLFKAEVVKSRASIQNANANANEAESADDESESGDESDDSGALGAAKAKH